MPTSLIIQMKWTNFLNRETTKLTQAETDNQTSLLSIKEAESVIQNLPKRKISHPYGFTGEFYHIFKEEIIPILHNLLHTHTHIHTTTFTSYCY